MPGLKYTPHAVDVPAGPHPQPVRLRRQTRPGPAGGDQPPAARGSAGVVSRRNLAAVAHGRNFPLRARQSPRCGRGGEIYDPQRSEVARGLDAGTSLPPLAAGGRRDELRRHGRNATRSIPTRRRMQRYGVTLATDQGCDHREQLQRRRRVCRPRRGGATWCAAWG